MGGFGSGSIQERFGHCFALQYTWHLRVATLFLLACFGLNGMLWVDLRSFGPGWIQALTFLCFACFDSIVNIGGRVMAVDIRNLSPNYGGTWCGDGGDGRSSMMARCVYYDCACNNDG